MHRFKNKVALITGAASGIGRATAIRLAEEGASLTCTDVNGDGLRKLSQELEALSAPHITQVCDVRDERQVAQVVEATIERFGRLNILCNVAGLLRTDHSHELGLDAWNEILAINLTGAFLMCREALPHLVKDSGNAIVNTSSTAALGAHPWMAAYAASKGGLLSLTKTLAIEYIKQGLRVNAICPGGVKTAMQGQFSVPEGADTDLMSGMAPRVNYAAPEAVAAAIAFIASDDASYMYGTELRVDGGALA